jgi:hypothetical protein
MTSYYPMNSADQLYALLPDVYRNKDRSKGGDPSDDLHLQRYLESFGALLDQVRHTLEQRYDDSFPDNSVPGHECQDWIVPYFADLLAVGLHSPFLHGQRDEVANGVRWAQRKGSLQAVEEIAEAITQSEAEIQEGWKRVATTARIGLPLQSAVSMGEAEPMPPDPGAGSGRATPQQIARHPAIRAVTPDFRQISRSVEAEPGSPSSDQTRFGASRHVWPQDDAAPAYDDGSDGADDDRVFWRQANPHGVPCFPGAYNDVSLRTVDLRTPGAGRGRYHPKRLLVFLPPPYGMCAPKPYRFAWSAQLDSVIEGGASDPDAPKLSDFVTRETRRNGSLVYRNIRADAVEITGEVIVDNEAGTRFEKLRFADGISLKKGKLELLRCAVKTLASEAPAETQDEEPLIKLKACLVETITAADNILQAEYVTVLGDLKVRRLLASDAIFAGTIGGIHADDCVRFSRVSADYFTSMPPLARKDGVTTAPPEFFTAIFCTPGCGVLRQDASKAIRHGAEDGGEMGTYHDWHYGTRLDALAAKLKDYLPIGIEPVVIWDDQLLCRPPKPAGV